MQSRYLTLIDNARKVVAIAFAVCGAGFVLSVRRAEWLRDVMRRDAGVWAWGEVLFGIGILACLLATVGLIVESLIRLWNGRPLTLVEAVIAGLLGLLVCLAIVPAFIIVAVLCSNVGSGSFVELLAAGTLLCLFATFGLGIEGFIRGRHGHHSPLVRPRFALASLFGVIACISFTVFAWLRAHDGREQQQTVGALQNASCVVYYDYEVGHDGQLDSKSTSWAPELLLSRAGKDIFHHVVRVDLKDAARDVDVLIPHLQTLPHLRFVSIPEWAPITQVRQLESALPSCNFRIDQTPEIEHIGGDDDFSPVTPPG